MPRNYQVERDAIFRRWYGNNPQPLNPRPNRSPGASVIGPEDCLGIPIPVNLPFMPWGHCMVWKYTLNQGGYGVQRVGGKQQQGHRLAYIQTRGEISEGKQVNHLCNRPYCVQPSHLYAGTHQDNSDDARIFSDPERLHDPWVLHMPAGDIKDELRQRLREAGRYEAVEPWEPVMQPPQIPLEEFVCPKHDFAITMFGGNSRICRICETSEGQLEMLRDFGRFSLISDLYPFSQYVPPIFEKIAISELTQESHAEFWEKAHNRSFGNSVNHDPRFCSCRFCSQDRETLRQAIQPLLTGDESEIIDVCYRLRPEVERVIGESQAKAGEQLARLAGLNEEQTGTFVDHYRDCPNSRQEAAGTAKGIEGVSGALLYALSRLGDPEELKANQDLELIWLQLSDIRAQERDMEVIEGTIIPMADEAAGRIMERWADEAARILDRAMESGKTELYEVIRKATGFMVLTRLVDNLRFEITGRNSHTMQSPHPHQHCLEEIGRTGQWTPFPEDFQEGMGYNPSGQSTPSR